MAACPKLLNLVYSYNITQLKMGIIKFAHAHIGLANNNYYIIMIPCINSHDNYTNKDFSVIITPGTLLSIL